MRWAFLFLLALNLFYFVWHRQQAPIKPKEVAPLVMHKAEQRGIKLLSESGGHASRVGEAGLSSAAAVCLFMGPLDSRERAQEVEQRLISLDIAVQMLEVDAEAGVDYWVYLPPLASRQASLRQLRELQARKIDSYLITEGDLVNGISLGIFPRTSSADSVLARLRAAGYEPLMRELPRAHRSFWVRVEPVARRLVDDALLAQLAQDFDGLGHQLMPCESIAVRP